MTAHLTVIDFMKQFSNDDACLDYLMQLRHGKSLDCPKCGKRGRFTRIRKMPAYSCPWCGHHIHPMVGTPFHRSHTPLQKWFYAMYLFTTTRHGVPAKELQRQLGVSYPTAFRIAHKIREYMGTIDGDPPLSGPGRGPAERTAASADHAMVQGRSDHGRLPATGANRRDGTKEGVDGGEQENRPRLETLNLPGNGGARPTTGRVSVIFS